MSEVYFIQCQKPEPISQFISSLSRNDFAELASSYLYHLEYHLELTEISDDWTQYCLHEGPSSSFDVLSSKYTNFSQILQENKDFKFWLQHYLLPDHTVFTLNDLKTAWSQKMVEQIEVQAMLSDDWRSLSQQDFLVQVCMFQEECEKGLYFVYNYDDYYFKKFLKKILVLDISHNEFMTYSNRLLDDENNTFVDWAVFRWWTCLDVETVTEALTLLPASELVPISTGPEKWCNLF